MPTRKLPLCGSLAGLSLAALAAAGPPAALPPRRQLQQRRSCTDLEARMVAIDCQCFGQVNGRPVGPSDRQCIDGRPPTGAALDTCSPGCAGVLMATLSDCALDATQTARLSDMAPLCGGVAQMGDASEWQRGSCSGHAGTCLNGGACLERTGSGHRRLQAAKEAPSRQCPVAGLDARLAAVDAACCGDKATSCSSGAPSTCSTACAQAVPTFWSDCASTLSGAANGATMVGLMQTVVQLCAAAAPAHSSSATGPASHRCVCEVGFSGDHCELSRGKVNNG